MGVVAEKLSNRWKSVLRALGARSGDAEPLSGAAPSVRDLIDQGHDPTHACYAQAQNLASVFAEAVSQFDELDSFAQVVAKAEDTYLPQGPPMSPLTMSYFTLWAFFDVPFGPDHETLGTCMLERADRLGLNDVQLEATRNLARSRMGIFEHAGTVDAHIRLRELVTEEVFEVHPTSNYWGQEGELWFVRLSPPVTELAEGPRHHIVMTTPYVLLDTTRDDWIAYLNKNLPSDRDASEGLHVLLKHGREPYHWPEFIFQAYKRHQHEAVFLSGLPDVKASLPHATP